MASLRDEIYYDHLSIGMIRHANATNNMLENQKLGYLLARLLHYYMLDCKWLEMSRMEGTGPPISLVVLYKEMILYSCAFVKTQTVLVNKLHNDFEISAIDLEGIILQMCCFEGNVSVSDFFNVIGLSNYCRQNSSYSNSTSIEDDELEDELEELGIQNSNSSNDLNVKFGSNNSSSSNHSTQEIDQVSDVFAILLHHVTEGTVKCKEKVQQQLNELSMCRDELTVCKRDQIVRSNEMSVCCDELSLCKYDLLVRSTELSACRGEQSECRDELSMCRDELTVCGDELSACRDELSACRDELTVCEREKIVHSNEMSACRDELSACRDELTVCEREKIVHSNELSACRDELTASNLRFENLRTLLRDNI